MARVALVALIAPALGACMGSGIDFGTSSSVDKATTHSVSAQYAAQPDNKSDEATVRNALSSADLARSGGETTIPWANTTTGSAGVISQIREENNGSYMCRTFMTTRHSYRGVSNFAGKACLVGSGSWQLVNFAEQG